MERTSVKLSLYLIPMISSFNLQLGWRVEVRSYFLILRSDLSTSYFVVYMIIPHLFSIDTIYDSQRFVIVM